ncbi:Peroxide operon regulator [Fundidesulfovibrio magnetotacticus]|uniref:Peroxide operon regulator n=1 Tax=Fundidesulfovibrio magnetotacticus TaxID=2730080 RepID=A0A6V8LTV4_9BACT|nr:Fur family transcriptional regulator [Fundidesulfovibrio magnetotacticus]GFK95902.1 Peroxide operon regulator [Fundidesulfovibrio magnetotacticus]
MEPLNPASQTDRLAAILERLKAKGLRLTPQRLAIVKAVLAHPGHPTVEQIHREILNDYPTTSLATVYKTVALLKAEGEILELGFGEQGSRYDGLRPRPHPHMICSRCGEILDLELDDLDDIVARFAASTGYAVDSHRFDVFGVCPRCRESG